MADKDILSKVVSLCKRRGFVYPGSEIYGGLANTYDFGPLGTILKRNLESFWWKTFVTDRSDIYGLDTSILMSPKVWEASGHTASFVNVLVDCTKCHFRTRADHLIEDALENIGNIEGKPLKELDEIIAKNKILCPKCKSFSWTKSRNFNQLFETKLGIITTGQNTAYLRGELAQGMFVNFKNIINSFHPKLPFGLAQSGKAFRNEITLGKFTFRTLEFDLAEFEYFIKSEDWENTFEYWREEMFNFALRIGLQKESLRWRAHTKEELAHYSKRTEDLEYKFPWGFKEMWGLAYRTDYDLKNHIEKSGIDLSYTDRFTNDQFVPHVIEPTFGLSRLTTIILLDSYFEDEKRVVLKFKPCLAPYKVAVFPLLANKPELVKTAKKVYLNLKSEFSTTWDERGNIGKRYFAQDEIGTPWCITVDFETLKSDTVTIRDRDTTGQERVSVNKLKDYLKEKLK